jgi:hypothetical protein
MKNKIRLIALLSGCLIISPMISAQPVPLAEGFLNPPVIARPKALWPWVNGNFSLSQITYELEQAKHKGMGGFDIWDVGTDMNPDQIVPVGPAFLSDESLNAIAHTVREADRLGLEIGLITSSSWNAGGAWVKPEHGAMGLFRTDTVLIGPANFSGIIPLPDYPEILKNSGSSPFYKKIALLAYPLRNDSTLSGSQEIVDLGIHDDNSGRLNWEVPPGTWKIIRYVCMPTGQQLAIPSSASEGLMLDHFSAGAQEANMKYVIGRLKSVLGSLKNRSLKYLYEDSYEVNSAVWTTDLPEQFKKSAGYSIVPYLPVLDGFTISSDEITERFLFDFTKLLSDLIIENHYTLGRKLAESEGLGFYAEAGGPGKPIHNVPFEDLKALGSLTVPRGEFWNKHPQLDKLQIIKGIASASHIYNQKYVEAESFTSVWLWQEGPGELKPLADRAMCEGLNRFVYHTFPHTPPESGVPGWIYNFGTIINTTNGWWPKSEGFHEYLARCSYLLQQGNFVGDVAFYYGDKAPNFVSPKHIPTSLGYGYDYDVVNSDIILNRMTVKNGRICLPHGQVYEVLVLPNEKQVNPDVLHKIEQLVADGATVIGPKPTRSYSLAHATEQDAIIMDLAGRLWGKCDSIRVRENIYGKGRIVWGNTIREVLDQKKVYPDLLLTGGGTYNPVDFIHRTVEGTEIYFIRNKEARQLNATCRFRVVGKLPEYWDPQTGEIKPVDLFKQFDEGTELPLSLGSYGSCFIVFREPVLDRKGKFWTGDQEILFTPAGGVQLQPEPLLELKGAWEVRFLFMPGTPVTTQFNQLVSWDKSDIPSIRNYSGTASYRTYFTIPAEQLQDKQFLFLELNQVKEIAEVYLNGINLGLHWDPAHRFDISGIVRPGENHLVVEVVNSINNMLVGDAGKPEQFRQTRSNITRLPNAWTTPFAEAPLIEAGLIGPVFIRWARLAD